MRSSGRKAVEDGAAFKPIWYLSPINEPASWLKLTIDAMGDEWDDKSVSVSSDAAEAPSDAASQASGGAFVMPKPPLWGFLLQPAAGKGSLQVCTVLSTDTLKMSRTTLGTGPHLPASRALIYWT